MTAVVEEAEDAGTAATEAEQADYRARVRAWFAGHSTSRTGASFAGEGIDVERSRAWQRQLFEAGLAGVAWPRQYGGGGGAAWQEVVVRQEAARFADSADDVFGTAIGLIGPAILAHGDEGQRDRHLPPILAGDQIWCQLFSEPDAGSDLAALATRAVPDGDGWVIDGQKVWSSGAHLSDYGLLLARTGLPDDGPRGISCFILPMHEPGVDVRQLRQLTGDAHFCQVYLDRVRLGPDALLGTVGGGWTVTRTVLAAERTLIAAGGGIDLPVLHLAELAAAGRFDLAGIRRDELVQAFIRARLIDWLSARLLERSAAAEAAPGPVAGPAVRSPEAAWASAGASLLKLAMADHVATTTDLAMSLLGPASLLDPGSLPTSESGWQRAFLGQWLIRIGGGTEQIQRNIIGERLLGLPREPPAAPGAIPAGPPPATSERIVRPPTNQGEQ